MKTLTFGTVLKAALIAGLAAGLTASVFHLVFTEPLIDRAVAMEEASHMDDSAPGVVSRDTQKKGLVVGFVMLGVAWSIIFGVAFQAAQRWLPPISRFKQGVVMAAFAYWAVALLPFLKYPANPPGVGDPDTIVERQALYAGFLVLSIITVLLGAWLTRTLQKRLSNDTRATSLGWAAIIGLSLLLFVLMPGIAEDGDIPDDLLNSFRVMSLVGLTIFWATMGLLFGKLIGQAPAHAA
ncbi:MAG TPA: CbtA family protein [Chloroflexota bacterium]|nr:CbtA family protein [Chloroflexota bacterium]